MFGSCYLVKVMEFKRNKFYVHSIKMRKEQTASNSAVHYTLCTWTTLFLVKNFKVK